METQQPSIEDNTPQIVLNKNDILAQIEINQKYSKDGVTIRKWEGGELSNQFIADINKNTITFLGILNPKLQKDNYGVLTYPNGEKYFGMFQKELRNKQGFYEYQPKTKNNRLLSEFYFGVWRDNQKDDHGVYLWLNEDVNAVPFSDFDAASFDCYCGEITNEAFSHGTYMSKKGEEYFLYHGGFNSSNEKHGDNCFYYNATKDELMFGNVRHNKYINGFIAMFDEDGKMTHIMQCEYDENGNITQYKQKEEIEENLLGNVCNNMELFRNVILGEDYFGIVYDVFKRTKEYVDEKINSIDVFDSEEEFPKLMSVSFQFNEVKIYQNIEKNISY